MTKRTWRFHAGFARAASRRGSKSQGGSTWPCWPPTATSCAPACSVRAPWADDVALLPDGRVSAQALAKFPLLLPEPDSGIRQQLEREMHKMKQARGVKNDTDLTADDLKELIEIYKVKVKEVLTATSPSSFIATFYRSENGGPMKLDWTVKHSKRDAH